MRFGVKQLALAGLACLSPAAAVSLNGAAVTKPASTTVSVDGTDVTINIYINSVGGKVTADAEVVDTTPSVAVEEPVADEADEPGEPVEASVEEPAEEPAEEPEEEASPVDPIKARLVGSGFRNVNDDTIAPSSVKMHVKLMDAFYIPDKDASTFRYKVKAVDADPRTSWVLALEGCVTPEHQQVVPGLQPAFFNSEKMFGVTNREANVNGVWTLSVKGRAKMGQATFAVVTPDGSYGTGSVQGPVCEGVSVENEKAPDNKIPAYWLRSFMDEPAEEVEGRETLAVDEFAPRRHFVPMN